ncbi:MAG: hypothetical protein IIZ89_04130 [Muribaculaceae bacterium]|nr:hypothetical protein [Muribaculaceae bacterium]
MKHLLTLALLLGAQFAYGQQLLTLKQLPTTNNDFIASLVVNTETGEQTAYVNYHHRKVQTIPDVMVMPYEGNIIHYVDANFDGHMDVYVGTGESRSANVLLLWDKKRGEFKLWDDDYLQNPVFDAEEKVIYSSGSSSAWDYDYTKQAWSGGKLITVEQLNRHTSEDGVTRYSLMRDDKLVLNTTVKKQLPAEWRRIIALEQ